MMQLSTLCEVNQVVNFETPCRYDWVEVVAYAMEKFHNNEVDLGY
jgi:hypothetical protein